MTSRKTRRYLNDFILCFFIYFYFSYVVFLNINKFEMLVFYNVVVLFSLFLFFDFWSLKNYLIFSSLGFFVAYFFENPFLLKEVNLKYFLVFLFCLFYVFFMWFYYVKNKQKILDFEVTAMREQANSISHELSGILAGINLKLGYFKKIVLDPNQNNLLLKLERDVVLAQTFLEITKNNYRDYLPKSKNEKFFILESVRNLINEFPLTEKEKSIIHISGEDFLIHFDRVLLYSVLVNLLKNSLFFIKKAGKGEIYIVLEKKNNQTHNALIFKDTGFGIKSDYLPYIFDRFFSRRRHGTGMGLYFCKFIMQHYSGDIRVSSVEKKYTQFKLLFPEYK